MEEEELKQEATVDKREETGMTEEQVALIQNKQECTKEIAKVLKKYNCDMKAQLTINEERTVSQIFIFNLPTDEK